jgi:hypothetical protein
MNGSIYGMGREGKGREGKGTTSWKVMDSRPNDFYQFT